MHAFWLVFTYDLLEDRRIDDVIIKSFFSVYFNSLLYKTNTFQLKKLPCVCSVIDRRWRQNVVRTSVTHSAAPRVPLFCSYYILTSSMIYYWTDTRQLGIYLLMIWYDMIWYDMIWYVMLWYDMIWYDMIWYDMIWYDKTLATL